MVVWLLIIVIIALCAVIIIRDQKIREAISGFFNRVRKKIHVARIKSQINKEYEKKNELLTTLGETAWSKGVDLPAAAGEKSKADALAREKKDVDEDIDRLNAEIERIRKSFEEFSAKQDAAIKENEEKRDPLENELAQAQKELGDQEKEINDREKTKAKIEKKLASYREKITEVEQDQDLSNIEKNEKKSEIENTIKELENNRTQILQEIDSFKNKTPALQQKVGELEPRVKAFEEKIKTLKEGKKAEEKKADEATTALRTNRNNQISKQSRLKKELADLFGKIGEKLAANRVESSDLSPLYAQIDAVNAAISELEKQISKEQKALGESQ